MAAAAPAVQQDGHRRLHPALPCTLPHSPPPHLQGWLGAPAQLRPTTVPNRHRGKEMNIQMSSTMTMDPKGTAARDCSSDSAQKSGSAAVRPGREGRAGVRGRNAGVVAPQQAGSDEQAYGWCRQGSPSCPPPPPCTPALICPALPSPPNHPPARRPTRPPPLHCTAAPPTW